MKPNIRSLSGAVLMLIVIPIFAGLLACMPVPIGNPERSRIDPEMSGVWILEGDGEDAALYQFHPYDKRTWLVTAVMPVPGEKFVGDALEIETRRDLVDALETYSIGETGLASDFGPTPAYKAWLTKLGGEQFMTWQYVGGFNGDGSFMPEYWWVFKVDKQSVNRFDIYMIDPEHTAFEGIVWPDDYEGDDYTKDMRRKWERALAKHAKDGDLYTEPMSLSRLPNEHMEKASELFQQVTVFE